jgi:hypothetical protein
MMNSLGLPAKGVGTVVGYLIGERFGRKISFVAMQFVVLAGIALSYASKTYGQIVAGRVLVQAFVGWEDWLCPMFWAELAPAQIRGSMVCRQWACIVHMLTLYCSRSYSMPSLTFSDLSSAVSLLTERRNWIPTKPGKYQLPLCSSFPALPSLVRTGLLSLQDGCCAETNETKLLDLYIISWA